MVGFASLTPQLIDPTMVKAADSSSTLSGTFAHKLIGELIISA